MACGHWNKEPTADNTEATIQCPAKEQSKTCTIQSTLPRSREKCLAYANKDGERKRRPTFYGFFQAWKEKPE
jgi:hypothetical protein